jgi:hypothetical protein
MVVSGLHCWPEDKLPATVKIKEQGLARVRARNARRTLVAGISVEDPRPGSHFYGDAAGKQAR